MPVKYEKKTVDESPVEVETEEVVKPVKQATTNWAAFERAGLVPKEIVCQGYLPIHRADMSCHTRLVPKAENLISHTQNDHGGGFRVTVKRTEGKAWAGWEELKKLGADCFDLRCDVCDAVLQFQPNHLLAHMKAHQGKNRRIQPGGVFWITLSLTSSPKVEGFDAEMD